MAELRERVSEFIRCIAEPFTSPNSTQLNLLPPEEIIDLHFSPQASRRCMIMPQTSLMGWLSKPAQANPAEIPHKGDKQHLFTPPDESTEQEARPTQPGGDGAPNTSKNHGLSPNVEFRECRAEDIKSFKRLNSLLLPIPYADSFYREIMEDAVTRNITVMAIWHDDPSVMNEAKGTLVGAIRCRLLANLPGAGSPRKEGPMLYLSTLVLLSPYRGHGIAAKMLDIMLRRAVNEYGIASVGAHVWEANEEGLAWYRKRGFKEVAKEEGYYRRLKPQGAMVMMKEVGVFDLLEK